MVSPVLALYVTSYGSTGFEIEFRLHSDWYEVGAAEHGHHTTLSYQWHETPFWNLITGSTWDCGLCPDLIDWYEIPFYNVSSGFAGV